MTDHPKDTETQSQPPPSSGCPIIPIPRTKLPRPEEDEISLLDYWRVIWEKGGNPHKFNASERSHHLLDIGAKMIMPISLRFLSFPDVWPMGRHSFRPDCRKSL